MDKKLMHVDSGSTAVSAIRIIVSSAGNLRLECVCLWFQPVSNAQNKFVNWDHYPESQRMEEGT
jgi:hypothetical protein